jgi:hypothetical protein
VGHTLGDELTAYRVRISDDGHDSYGNGREAANDDLVLALAIALYASNRPRGTRMTHAGLERSVPSRANLCSHGVERC